MHQTLEMVLFSAIRMVSQDIWANPCLRLSGHWPQGSASVSDLIVALPSLMALGEYMCGERIIAFELIPEPGSDGVAYLERLLLDQWMGRILVC